MEAKSRTMPTRSPRLALVLAAAPGGGGGERTAGGGGGTEPGAGPGTGPSTGAGPGAGPGALLGEGAGAGVGGRGGRGGRLNPLVGDCANSRVGGRAVFCRDDWSDVSQDRVGSNPWWCMLRPEIFAFRPLKIRAYSYQINLVASGCGNYSSWTLGGHA
jgi:hypothetical protein